MIVTVFGGIQGFKGNIKSVPPRMLPLLPFVSYSNGGGEFLLKGIKKFEKISIHT